MSLKFSKKCIDMFVVVTGAASGIGQAFVNSLSDKYSDVAILAIDRTFTLQAADTFTCNSKSSQWRELHIEQLQLDIQNSDHASQLGIRLERESVDLVVHSAGVRGLVKSVAIESSDDVAKADNLNVMDDATFRFALEVNSIGAFLILRATIPALLRSSRQPKVVVIGSRMGSIGYNQSAGGAYAYRASKAALNAIVKSFSIDVPKVVWTVVHPGRLQTGLVSVKEEGALSVNEGVADIMQLIERLQKDDSGRFVDRFGVDIPW